MQTSAQKHAFVYLRSKRSQFYCSGVKRVCASKWRSQAQRTEVAQDIRPVETLGQAGELSGSAEATLAHWASSIHLSVGGANNHTNGEHTLNVAGRVFSPAAPKSGTVTFIKSEKAQEVGS